MKKAIMNKKTISYLSTAALLIGTGIGVYALADIYLLKRQLSSGVCPVTSNKPLLYIAIALCCLSFILSFFSPKAKNEQNENDM